MTAVWTLKNAFWRRKSTHNSMLMMNRTWEFKLACYSPWSSSPPLFISYKIWQLSKASFQILSTEDPVSTWPPQVAHTPTFMPTLTSTKIPTNWIVVSIPLFIWITIGWKTTVVTWNCGRPTFLHAGHLANLGLICHLFFTNFSYHGHPQPLTAPLGHMWHSMALYYYTNGRPKEECLDGDCSGQGHSTLFKMPMGCEKCEEDMCKAYEESKPNWVTAFN